MQLELERRAERSRIMMFVSPVIAIALTVLAGALLFALVGIAPGPALYVYFIEPLTTSYSLQEVAIKAAPLVLIGIGLSICFLSNTWNIGAEGQFTMGGVAGGGVALAFYGVESAWILPLMMIAGMAGGAAWAAIPAALKTRFNANEILTSLMLTYVALLVLDYLVRGPWRNPEGFNFPESRLFHDAATLAPLLSEGRLHAGVFAALIAVIAAWILLGRTLKGFEIRVLGQTPRAGNFAGFSHNRLIYFAFLVSGALAGLAGIMEVAGPIGQLVPSISPGYGFTAIIVAFLGRLNPVGVLFAGLLLALSYIGGEGAQISLGVPQNMTQVFQGLLLFFVLACDTLILYRIRVVRRRAHGEASHGRA